MEDAVLVNPLGLAIIAMIVGPLVVWFFASRTYPTKPSAVLMITAISAPIFFIAAFLTCGYVLSQIFSHSPR